MMFSTRLNSFDLGKGLKHPKVRTSTVDLIKIAGTVEGLDALELNYPEHFEGEDVADIKAALDASGLALLGIQLRWPAPEFSDGGFTNPDAGVRKSAIQLVEQAADMAKELGADHVLLWPAHDGYEYLFQMDYVAAWGWWKDALSHLASSYPELRFSIEYKPAEPRARTLLNSTGATLKLVNDVGAPNVGLTLDFAHLLMAHETPAQSAAMALGDGRLFGLQMNDGFGAADDGLMVGALHPYETLELVYYLLKHNYAGTYYFDTDPVREEPIRECEMNIRRMKHFIKLASEMIADGVSFDDGDALRISEVVSARMFAGA